MTTSQPSIASTRAVAALTPGKNAPCTQPVSMPTVAPRWPRGPPTRSGSAGAVVIRGARSSIVASVGASRASSPLRRTSRCSPVRWYARSGPRSSRSRRG